MCFIMFLISVGHFLGFSSPRDITNFVHYETEKLDLLNDFLHDDFNVCGIFGKPLGHGPNLVHNESLQTNLLLSDVVRN